MLLRKRFRLMSGLNFTLIDITLFLADNMSGLQKNTYSGLPLVIFQVSTPRCAMEITLNDSTSSQKVFFFFYFFFFFFFFRCHFIVKNKKFWENSKCIELTWSVKWPTWLFDGKVRNILLSVLTLFRSLCHAFFNFSTVSRLLHLLFFLLWIEKCNKINNDTYIHY